MSTFSRPVAQSQEHPIPADAGRVWITELISAQAATRPEAVAVSEGEDELTYRWLDTNANQLAHSLQAAGVGPNVVVGLCLPRSCAMTVGALAILKAGGAYLPLDPGVPAARLQFIVENAQPACIITNSSIAASLPAISQQLIVLDRRGRQTGTRANYHTAAPPAEAQPGDLAYVIYTSGSTGEPKGVEISHESLQNLVAWHTQAFALTPADRATQLASPGFDAAVWELWPYLTAGASLHIPDDDTIKDPERLRAWLLERAITMTFVATPMAERLIDLPWPATTKLRILLTGADTLRHYPAASLPFKLVNNYGPTECTVVTTSGAVPSDTNSDGLPPIGRPIPHVQVYILDDNLQQVPTGEPGELYIGGAGLARGYRNRPDLTAERFVTNPWAEESGSARLYRTGDRGTYLPDGQIRFMGRNDDQVKIRGYRVELDEVAAAIGRHAAVAANVVAVREEDGGEKQLVAYITFQPDEHLTQKDLRDYLLQSLPDYMVPAVFCRLDSLPLTASGKVDRKALPAPAVADRLMDDAYVAPRTPLEARVAALLSDLLHLDRIGVTEDFFLIGGNSLLGTQAIARVRDAFHVDLSLLSFFNHPTISELSAEIEQLLIAQLEFMSEEEAQRMLETPIRRAA